MYIYIHLYTYTYICARGLPAPPPLPRGGVLGWVQPPPGQMLFFFVPFSSQPSQSPPPEGGGVPAGDRGKDCGMVHYSPRSCGMQKDNCWLCQNWTIWSCCDSHNIGWSGTFGRNRQSKHSDGMYAGKKGQKASRKFRKKTTKKDRLHKELWERLLPNCKQKSASNCGKKVA
jgi:hypothetical protein